MNHTDLLLTNANVITMDPSNSVAAFVAVKRDRIVAVGGSGEEASFRTAATRVIDCQGATVIPGFNDAHCHVYSLIRNQLTVDLHACKSISEIKVAIRRKAFSLPAGQWINGSDYSDFNLAEKRHPNRWDLDEAAPNNPVIISHRSLHACVLNSPALQLADIRIDTPEPPGASIHRDEHTGEPDGILFEMLGYVRYRVMPPLSDIELESGIRSANRLFLSQGITSLQDATVTNDVKRWEVYTRAKAHGQFKPRLYMMTGVDSSDAFAMAGMSFRFGDDALRLGGLKIVLGEATGQLFPAQQDLNSYVLSAHRLGRQVAIHAVELSTVEAAVEAIDRAVRAVPRPDHRHRLEHCAECPAWLLERLAHLGVVVSTQPPFLYYSGDRYLSEVPAETLPWLYRFKAYLDRGIVVASGSDAPVVPNNPLVGIQSAVLRTSAAGVRLSPEESVSALEALASYTIGAAYASFDERVKGSIVPGKFADMVLLSDDPSRVAPDAIQNIKVEKTFVGGELAWES